jgi:Spy/CpxP family protein refolding chaperone
MKFTMNRRRWLGLSLAGIAGAGALGALFAAPAIGGGGWLGHGGHGERWGQHGGHHFDDGEIRDHVEWMLRGTDASDAQIDEIARIASSTAQELHGLREGARGAHDEITAALGERVDRAALEALRAEHLAAAETASRKLTDALAQAAEILTPAQRKALIERHAKHLEGHGRE